MGVDEGFDMVPRLSQGGPDSRKWEAFINTIKSYYVDDDQVEVRASCIVFKVGEWPALPFQGHQFLRFSSKVTGGEHEVPGVSTYIRAVTRAARKIFGARVVFWSEFADQLGFYDWRAVHEARRSYDEVRPTRLLSSLFYPLKPGPDKSSARSRPPTPRCPPR